MSDIATRSRELQPSIYLTLGAIIQSLSFGILLSRVLTWGSSEAPGGGGALFWVHFLIALLVIVMIWHEYAIGVICFVWTWSYLDSALPFLLGVAQIFLISRVGTDDLASWFAAMAVVGAAGVFALINQYVRASRERANFGVWNRVHALRKRAIVTLGVSVGVFLTIAFVSWGRDVDLRVQTLVLVLLGFAVIATSILSHGTLSSLVRADNAPQISPTA